MALALARLPDDPGAVRERQEHRFAVKAARAGIHQETPPAISVVPAPRPDTSEDARVARDLHVALNGDQPPPPLGASRRLADPVQGSWGAPVVLSDSAPTPPPTTQYDAHVWAFDKLFTRFQGPDPPPPGPMSRNPWLAVETSRTSPWDQMRAAQDRKAQVNDDDDANV